MCNSHRGLGASNAARSSTISKPREDRSKRPTRPADVVIEEKKEDRSKVQSGGGAMGALIDLKKSAARVADKVKKTLGISADEGASVERPELPSAETVDNGGERALEKDGVVRSGFIGKEGEAGSAGDGDGEVIDADYVVAGDERKALPAPDATGVRGGEVVEEVSMDDATSSRSAISTIHLPVVISLNSVLRLVQDTPVERLYELNDILCANNRFNNLPTDESDVVLMAMSIKRLVEERNSAEIITGYIGEQVRLLEQTSSAAVLCNVFPRLSELIRLAITDAQQELGMGASVPEQVLRSVPSVAPKTPTTPSTPSGLQAAVAREAAAAVKEPAVSVPKAAVSASATSTASVQKLEFPREITFGNLVAFVQALTPGDLRAGTSLYSLFNSGLETKPWAGLSLDERSVIRLLVDFRSGAVSKKQLPGLVGEGIHSVKDPSLYLMFDAMLPEVGLKALVADLVASKASIAQAPAPKPQAPQAPARQKQAPVAPPAQPAPKPQVREASTSATLVAQLQVSQNPIKLFESLPEAQRAAFTGDEMMAARVAIITRTNALRNQAVMGLPSKGDMGLLLQKLGLSEKAIADKRAKESGAARVAGTAQGARGLQQGAAPSENALFSEDVKAEMARILEGAKKREAQGSINRNEVWFALRRAMEVNPTCRAEFGKHQHVFWLIRSYLGKAFGRGWIEDNAPMFVRRQSDRPETQRRY